VKQKHLALALAILVTGAMLIFSTASFAGNAYGYGGGTGSGAANNGHSQGNAYGGGRGRGASQNNANGRF
jgi:hypothetical protein